MKKLFINDEQQLFDAFNEKNSQHAESGDTLILTNDILLHKDLCITHKVNIEMKGKGKMLYTNGYRMSYK